MYVCVVGSFKKALNETDVRCQSHLEAVNQSVSVRWQRRIDRSYLYPCFQQVSVNIGWWAEAFLTAGMGSFNPVL
jgi:hypothetical protein